MTSFGNWLTNIFGTNIVYGLSEENNSGLRYINDRNNRTITICSNAIANSVASIPINIYKLNKDGFRELQYMDIRYNMLHHNPNNYTTRFTFWHSMEYAKQKYGNAFAIINKYPNSIDLTFVHPTNYVDYIIDKGFLKYRFNVTGRKSEFDSSEVIHLKRTSTDSIIGDDPYIVLMEELEREYYANQTVTSYWRNSGKNRVFLKTKYTTGNMAKLKEAINEFRKESGGSYKDSNGNFKTGNRDFLPFEPLPGDTELQELSNDLNVDLYTSLLQDCDLKIAAYYQIPPQYLNILQAQTIANAETRQLDFKTSTIQNTLSSNRQELEKKLLTSDEIKNGYSIEYNTMAIVELDHETRMKGYESLQKTAWLTPNEVRKQEGYPAIDGGDEHMIFEQFVPVKEITKDDLTK